MTTRLGEIDHGEPIIDLTTEPVEGARIHRMFEAGSNTENRDFTANPLYGRIGYVHAGNAPAIRPTLGLAMRTHRIETPVDRALATAQRRKAAVEVPSMSLAAARADVTNAGDEESELRERVARLGGRVAALRETGGADPGADEAALDTATTALAEAETNHIAAKQRLARAREEARSVRDQFERRRRLADRVNNRQREAREYLVIQGWDRFRHTVAEIPAAGPAGAGPSEWSGQGWVATLAIIHLARIHRPVVVANEIPESVATPGFLGTPIIRV